jgi:6-phosphogluconate dehydrogenase
MLVKAGAPVDQTIATLAAHLERGDCIIDEEMSGTKTQR